MKILQKTALTTAIGTLLLLPGSSLVASERLEDALGSINQLPKKDNPETTQDTSKEIVEEEDSNFFICKGCTDTENRILKALQERGITDKNALAVILGNIRQESKFELTICEGGVRTGYHGCHRGGFGLIQWTTQGRYDGLGRHAASKGLNPNTLDAQLSWMFNEREWRSVEHKFKTPGQSSRYYMNAAYRWLGWGVHGARSHYATQYLSYLH